MAMADNDTTDNGLSKLLAEMPRIAEAVNAFSSEAVQKQAFDALVAAQQGKSPTKETSQTTPTRRKPGRKTTRAKRDNNDTGERKARRATGPPKMIRDLDLAPKGKTSLKDFVAEKQPKTQHDRNTVSVYYLSRIAEKSPVTVDHVFTCYRLMNWRPAPQFANSLALTASRKGYIDTADSQDIKVTPHGDNHVAYDLPKKKKED